MESTLTEKIRHLLAMAEHPNSNEHEAATAMAKAQELLFQNNLTRAEIQPGHDAPIPASVGCIDGVELTGFNWKRCLLGDIAKANLCKVIGTPSTHTWHLFGSYENVRMVLEMYRWLVPQLETMSLNAWKAYKADGTGRETAIRFKTGFYFGATNTIKERLSKALNEFTSGPGQAITLCNDKAVGDAIKRVFPHLTTSYRRTGSYDGLVAGKHAGNSIHLREQRKLSGHLSLARG